MARKKRGRPRSANPKVSDCNFRVTRYEKNRIRMMAEIYAGGDESKWLRYAALNCRPKFLK
jgi:hypothetical protein